jgi:VanZ family protein
LPTTAFKKRNRFLPILVLLAWMGLILFLSSRSSLPSDSPVVEWIGQYQDEVGHLGEYAVLGMLTFLVLRPRLSGRRTFLFSLAFCIAFSLVDEAFQGMIPNRTPQLTDLFLDAVGAVSAIGMMSVLGPRLRLYWLRQFPGGASP